MGSSGGQSQSCNNPQGRLHPPLPVLAKFDQVTHHHKLLCKSPQEPLLDGGIASVFEPKFSATGSNSEISTFLQQSICSTQTQQPVETYPRPQHPEQFSKHRVIQNGDTRDKKYLSTGKGVGYLHRFQGGILPHTDSEPVLQYILFHIQGQSNQFKALPFGLSTAPQGNSRFKVMAKEVKLLALQRGIRIH